MNMSSHQSNFMPKYQTITNLSFKRSFI